MTNKLYFAIVLHFHQPVGNFENVLERAYKFCYKPFFELLSNYPDICITTHFSGCLLDYFENKHPEILELIKVMASRGQIEVMSGAYYEPIISAIPKKDAIGQISLMSEYIKEKFGFSPKGMWIPERVWDPSLSRIISKSRIRYCVLDDTLLMRSGFQREDMGGYFFTGKGTDRIAVFPSDKKLRYTMPFKLPQKTISYLKYFASRKDGFLLTYADDGEKFGEWRGTYEWVYKNEWLKDFFETLRSNKDWIELVKPSDYLASNKPVAAVNIPEGSYDEMMEWAEGPWRNFLSKYPESNQMHKKACYVSEKIERLKKVIEKDDERIDAAKKELYKGQCNCSYWHGLYGGLYFYHLRSAIYNHLIAAEKIADEILHTNKKNWLEIKRVDFKPDSKKEFVMENSTFSLYFDSADGGVLRELDYRPLNLNLVNTLSRRKEAYHRVSHALDKYPRYCLRDHFIGEGLKKRDFVRAAYTELGDFDKGKYTAKKKGKRIILKRKSHIGKAEFEVSKEVEIKSDKEIVIVYHITARASAPTDVIFAVEFNVTMPHLNSDRYSYVRDGKSIGGVNANGSAAESGSFGICDAYEEMAFSLNFSKKAKSLWYFPVETVSQSEGKYGRSYQASCILPRWKLDFGKSKTWDLEINWTLGKV